MGPIHKKGAQPARPFSPQCPAISPLWLPGYFFTAFTWSVQRPIAHRAENHELTVGARLESCTVNIAFVRTAFFAQPERNSDDMRVIVVSPVGIEPTTY